jgi:hypothetical protein
MLAKQLQQLATATAPAAHTTCASEQVTESKSLAGNIPLQNKKKVRKTNFNEYKGRNF